MAWSSSNANAQYTYLMGTNGVKPSTDSFKLALFGNGVTPAQSTTAAVTQYAGAGSTWSTGNETSGTGYTAGGVTFVVTWAQSSNVVTLGSSATPNWTGASFTAYGAFAYDTTVNNQGAVWLYFGGAQTVTSGTFTVNFNASGLVAYSH